MNGCKNYFDPKEQMKKNQALNQNFALLIAVYQNIAFIRAALNGRLIGFDFGTKKLCSPFDELHLLKTFTSLCASKCSRAQ